jgi:hypothetical protein
MAALPRRLQRDPAVAATNAFTSSNGRTFGLSLGSLGDRTSLTGLATARMTSAEVAQP